MVHVHPALPHLPFRPSAWRWLQEYGVSVVVHDPNSTRGGGFWHPDRRLVELLTAQEEAAIHELAHAWWQERRDAQKHALIDAVHRLSKEGDPRYSRAARLAHVYIHGDPATGFKGMLAGSPSNYMGDEDNDPEMYAGLASGVMGRLSLLPPYIRAFYEELFDDDESEQL